MVLSSLILYLNRNNSVVCILVFHNFHHRSIRCLVKEYFQRVNAFCQRFHCEVDLRLVLRDMLQLIKDDPSSIVHHPHRNISVQRREEIKAYIARSWIRVHVAHGNFIQSVGQRDHVGVAECTIEIGLFEPVISDPEKWRMIVLVVVELCAAVSGGIYICEFCKVKSVGKRRLHAGSIL
jgi:hypothetical protein